MSRTSYSDLEDAGNLEETYRDRFLAEIEQFEVAVWLRPLKSPISGLFVPVAVALPPALAISMICFEAS